MSVVAANFQWRVHEGDEQGLAQRALLLLAMRRVSDGAALRAARRAPLLHQVLRERLRQWLRGVQQDHWN